MPRPLETVFHATVDSPRGPARFVTTEKGICAMSLPGRESGWLDRWIAGVISNPVVVEGTASDPHVAGARDQIAGYFAARRSDLMVPLDLRGTPFQQAVWREVARIPFGATRSFAAVAAALGPNATPGAVGSANQASPLPILVPTHRVLDGVGSVKGRGTTFGIHRWLLAHEGLLPRENELPIRWYRRMQVTAGPVYIGTPRLRTYCLPACINVQEEVSWVPRIFQSTHQARTAGFRPCPTCRPDTVIRRGPLPA